MSPDEMCRGLGGGGSAPVEESELHLVCVCGMRVMDECVCDGCVCVMDVCV